MRGLSDHREPDTHSRPPLPLAASPARFNEVYSVCRLTPNVAIHR